LNISVGPIDSIPFLQHTLSTCQWKKAWLKCQRCADTVM